ncbi:trans-sialidase, putative [Trypanosoma cruzi marinkellei]|uniref:Trans-sialidase, putative n=1 Tax=Trypanosoma cruzi marinkellei TaxID=85056 RepID=K2M3L3_TRYCR|nr:trans-sialidase, putative [Trypanosoma cruzi marinkellei]
MLVGNYSGKAATGGAQKSGAVDCGLLLVKGNVSTGESGSEKRIQWNENQRLVGSFSADVHKSLTQLIGGGGSGVKTTGGTLVFPVEATKKENSTEGKEMEKTVSLILYSPDNKSWTLSKGMSDGGCSNPSVVEWGKDGKLIMMTACDDGRRRVYESGDKGDSWTEALGTLSRVWGNKQGESVKHVGSGFITATIDGVDNRSVMLVTLPVYVKKTEVVDAETVNPKSELHLWLTDNTHIVDIGSVSSDEDDAASSLLYKRSTIGDDNGENKEELIALYEKKADGETPSLDVVPVRLTAELEEVKKVLKTWKEVDERVSKLCLSSIAADGTSPQNACSIPMPTDGLVGFLSGNFSDDTWRDEYLG